MVPARALGGAGVYGGSAGQQCVRGTGDVLPEVEDDGEIGRAHYRLTYDVVRYILNKVIQSFRCPETHGLFAGRESRRWRNVPAVALRKLDQLDAAVKLDDLRVPPGNHLEALKGHRKGQHSIRINDQWRLCFVWEANGAHCVEIVDYH